MATKATTQTAVVIKPANIQTAQFTLVGTAPFVQCRFSEKAMQAMADKMLAGSTATKVRARKARDFDDDFEQAKHISTDGWVGIPAGAFRNAMISACRLVGFKMTLAKLSLFVDADGLDKVDGVPLVKLQSPNEPERTMMGVRNATGVMDLRVRPMWREWHINLRVRYDADQFSLQDVANLLQRAGIQVGLGEGRPDSKSSAGLGWGTFSVT